MSGNERCTHIWSGSLALSHLWAILWERRDPCSYFIEKTRKHAKWRDYRRIRVIWCTDHLDECAYFEVYMAEILGVRRQYRRFLHSHRASSSIRVATMGIMVCFMEKLVRVQLPFLLFLCVRLVFIKLISVFFISWEFIDSNASSRNRSRCDDYVQCLWCDSIPATDRSYRTMG